MKSIKHNLVYLALGVVSKPVSYVQKQYDSLSNL